MRVILCLASLSVVFGAQGWKSFLSKLQPQPETMSQATSCSDMQHPSICNIIGEVSGCVGCLSAQVEGTHASSWHQSYGKFIGCNWDKNAAAGTKQCRQNDETNPEYNAQAPGDLLPGARKNGENWVNGDVKTCPDYNDHLKTLKDTIKCPDGKDAKDLTKAAQDDKASIVWSSIVPAATPFIKFIHTLKKFTDIVLPAQKPEADAKSPEKSVIGREICRAYILAAAPLTQIDPADKKACDDQLAGKLEVPFAADAFVKTLEAATKALEAHVEAACKADNAPVAQVQNADVNNNGNNNPQVNNNPQQVPPQVPPQVPQAPTPAPTQSPVAA